MTASPGLRGTVLTLAFAGPLGLAACQRAARAPESSQEAPPPPAATAAPPQQMRTLGYAAATAAQGEDAAKPAPPPAGTDLLASRKLIRTGQLTLEVADYGEAADKVAAVARARGGYLAESQSARGEHDRRQGTLTVRVPAERFEETVAALKQVALSTIVVTLREPEPVLQSGALQPIREALRDSLRVLASSVAALVYAAFALLPWLVLVALLAVAVRAIRRRRATSDGKRGGPA